MDITPVIPAGHQLIKGYGDRGFTISGGRWEGSVLVFPDRSLAWSPISMAEITADSLAPVLDASPELLLLGCGSSMIPLPSALRVLLRGAGIKVEIMDTGAACRTFNVLLAEDRRVAAALIAV